MSWPYQPLLGAAAKAGGVAPVFDQTAYRFYEDGTEAASSALGTQSVALSRDVTSDSVVLLRARIQETAGGSGAATDDYKLQYTVNAGTFYDIGDFERASNTIFSDSFTETSNTTLASHTPDVGTSWTQLINNGTDMAISGTTDTLNGSVATGGLSDGAFYTADTTYPSADYIVGATMVVGDTLDNTNTMGARVQDANNAYYVIFNESFATLFKKVGGTITELDDAVTLPVNGDSVELEVIGTSIKFYANSVEILSATDSSITAAGKAGLGIGDNFDQTRAEDVGSQQLDDFTVVDRGIYPPVTNYNSSNFAEGDATTNRLTGGSGSFVAGKTSKDGTNDNVQITASNFTELLYSLQLKSEYLVDTDVVTFRILKDGLTITYTVTPTINVTKGAAVNTRRYTLTTLGVG